MSTKLTQKHVLKGTQELEIKGEEVIIRTKAPFKQEESLSVMLTILNPEPVINKSRLEFVSRVNGEALISLALAKPDVAQFNAFVNTLKESAAAEYNAFVGMSSLNQTANPDAGAIGNSLEEPPEFSETSTEETIKSKKVDIKRVAESIEMLERYVTEYDIQSFIDALKDLESAPEDQDKLVKVATEFNALESQGAVLSYAPYISTMLADDPFSW